MKNILAILFFAVIVTACSDKSEVAKTNPGINGEYILENAKDTLVFTSNGEVTYKHPLFPTKVTNYKIVNSEITFKFPQGYPMKLSIIDDHHLKSMVGGTFVKQ